MNRIPGISLAWQTRKRVTEIEVTESAMKAFLNTVGKHPPETLGMFGGSLDRPLRLTEFRFCPPRHNADGSPDRSAVHVNVDAHYMNWVIENEWRPQGLDMLGIGHSHPRGCHTLTVGDPSRNEGDLVFFKSCLMNDDSPGRRWKICICPILVFDANGNPVIYWYAVTLDDPEPIPVIANIIPDEPSDTVIGTALVPPQERTRRYPPLHDKHDRLMAWQTVINAAEADSKTSERDRAFNAEVLRAYRYLDIDQDMRKTAARNGIADGKGTASLLLPPPSRSSRSRLT